MTTVAAWRYQRRCADEADNPMMARHFIVPQIHWRWLISAVAGMLYNNVDYGANIFLVGAGLPALYPGA